VEERIQKLILQWLKTRDVDAVSARIDETDWEAKTSWGSCDTCGPSSSYLELTIWYTTKDGYKSYVELPMNPLTFLAELLKLEDSK